MLKRTVSGLVLCACLQAQAFAQPQPAAAPPVRPVSWRYASEQEWIVNDVVSTLATLAGRSRLQPLGSVSATTLPSNGTLLRFRVEASGRETTVEIRDHIWAPANYVSLARLWMTGVRQSSRPEPASGVLSDLTTPRIEVLEAANREIGARLATGAGSRGPHDDAALLLGVMALREGPSFGGDVRPFLSKMTAHLAMAQAISTTPTPSGRVAQVLQLALVERQRDVIDRLKKWESTSPSSLERSWILALRIRATGDWRVLQHPKDASLLERLEYARALELRRGPTALLDFLDDSHPEDIADWTRIAENRSPTVESANRFSEDAVRGELRDAAVVWSRFFKLPLDAKFELATLLDALNDAPMADKSLVIDWPTWALSFQRHLARHIVAMVERESQTFGRPAEARTEAKELERVFGRLTFFPFAKLHYALDDGQYADAMKGAIGLMLRRPELVTSENWLEALEPRNGRNPTGVPSQSWWFTTLVPEGTAQDADNRVYTYDRTNHLTLPALRELRQVAPYSRYLLEEEMRWRYQRPLVPPLAEYEREAGVLAEYDSDVLGDLVTAANADPSAYVPLAERLCELQISRCQSLARYLADHDREEEAARAYRRWIDTDRDTVNVANGSSWLIAYYYTHGQQPAAIELAEKAAAAFSARGLLAKARLLERMGDYQAAEAIQKQVSERYDRTSDLAAFYMRWAKVSGDPGVKSAGDTLITKVFPRGLEPFAGAASNASPRDGVRVTETGATGAKAGFAVGDVIVAVDGIAVHNLDQLTMARDLDIKPDISFTAWKDGKYVTIQAPIRESWMSGVFVAYRAPAAR